MAIEVGVRYVPRRRDEDRGDGLATLAITRAGYPGHGSAEYAQAIPAPQSVGDAAHSLLHRSEQFDSGTPSTAMGQLQLRNGKSGTWRPERCGWGWENRRPGLAGTSRG